MTDETRWAAVYTHRERLLRVARARLGSAHDAEDCVQEAMLRCVEFADLDEERLGQFLTSVTVRLCADVHRGRLRGDRLHRRLTSYVAVEPGPEDAICDRAESAWLSGHLTTLTARQRAIVEARAEGLSCGDVAAKVQVSYTAVESSLARVRRTMRLALESTFGVVAGPAGWARVRRLLAAGTLTASAAVLTVGHLPGEVGKPAPRVVALPPGAGVTGAPARVAAVGPVEEATQSVSSTTPRAAAGGPAAVRHHPPAAKPVAHLDGPGDSGAQVDPPKETWPEFVARCLAYGVEPQGLVVDCGHGGGGNR